ncbi:TRAP transporter substrate-binding protein [Halomonas eurihalina]|nr:TRAP transporter substrate-binding protein [Halomonas eurihalina]MDR5858822.1 TRAP transporter substrate-binding protein [Halomonas eurihalina]
MKPRVLLPLAALAAAWVLSSATAMAEEVEIKLASWGPPSHFVAQARADWIEEVNEAAAGRVKIVEYPGGQLYDDKDMHNAVARGHVDIGVLLSPRVMGMVPLLQGVYLPFAFDSLEQVAEVYQGESLDIIEEAMAKRRMKLIYTSFVDGVQIYSTNKNVETLEDFENLRVLSTSPMATNIFSRLEASPDSSIPQTEQYMSLKLGVADASLNSFVNGYFQKMHEVAPYLTKIDLSFPTIMVAMNIDKWEALPEDVQEIMLSAGERMQARSLEEAIAWEEKFMAASAEEGATVSEFPDAEMARVREISSEVWQEWAEENGPEAQRLLELNLQ